MQTIGKINHLAFAVYVASDPNATSMIKIGSYDPQGFENPDDVGIFATIDKYSWQITIDCSFTYTNGDIGPIKEDLKSVANPRLSVDPSYPYIYIP